MSTLPAIDCIWDLKAELGEGLVWIASEQALYSVDIVGRQVHRVVPATGEKTSWEAPARPTFLVPVENEAGGGSGGLLCGHEDGLRRFDGATGRFGELLPVERLLPDNRLNDACVDPEGRLWFGTMHDPETAPTGSLYRLAGLDPAEAVQMDTGYVVTNGPAIDTVNRRLYHNDSARQTIFAFDLDPSGAVSGKRVFARFERGYPDGMTVDEAGTLWVALYGGDGVQCFAPDGTPTGFIPLPCHHITKIVFGDADYRTAYVSSARRGVDRPGQEQAGGIFRFRVDVPGLPPCAFKP